MNYRIGVVTSGGDAPGMNACVRAIVKGARQKDILVVGIRYGALGLLRNAEADFIEINNLDVANVIDQSGTFLKTARNRQVYEYLSRLEYVQALGIQAKDLLGREVGRKLLGDLAMKAIDGHKLNGLILIGGDTTCRAALAINETSNDRIPMVVIPATIDNDVWGTKQTLGFESAVSAAVRAVDAIRSSASSHGRIFIVEVMGRKHGFIAQSVGLACGAEEVFTPERECRQKELDELAARLIQGRNTGRESAVIIIAEGVDTSEWRTTRHKHDTRIDNPSVALKAEIESRINDWEVRFAILGHLQRGAPPTPYTRLLASRLGVTAVDYIYDLLRNPKSVKPKLLGVTGRDGFKLCRIQGDMIRESKKEMLDQYEIFTRLSY